jgi:hypothetical protein
LYRPHRRACWPAGAASAYCPARGRPSLAVPNFPATGEHRGHCIVE